MIRIVFSANSSVDKEKIFYVFFSAFLLYKTHVINILKYFYQNATMPVLFEILIQTQ